MSEVVKEGWMSKKGALVRAWRRRWFVLIGKELIYSKKPGLKPKGVINVDEIESLEKAGEASRDHVFLLKMRTGRIFSIQAEDDRDVGDWLTAIRKSMSPGGQASNSLDNYVPIQVFQLSSCFSTFVAKSKHNDALYFVDKYPAGHFENPEVVVNVESKFIVKTAATFPSDKFVIVVSEFVSARPLQDFVRSIVRLPHHTVQIYASEILIALNDLHKIGFVVGNLELDQVMIMENGHIRLRMLPSRLNLKRPGMNRGFCAPEVINNERLEPKADFWSLGVIIYCLLTGFTPFFRHSEAKMAEAIKNSDYRVPSDLSDVAADLLAVLFRKKGGNVTFDTLKRHQFFDGVEWDRVEGTDMMDVDKFWKPKIESVSQSEDKKAPDVPLFTMENIKEWSAF